MIFGVAVTDLGRYNLRLVSSLACVATLFNRGGKRCPHVCQPKVQSGRKPNGKYGLGFSHWHVGKGVQSSMQGGEWLPFFCDTRPHAYLAQLIDHVNAMAREHVEASKGCPTAPTVSCPPRPAPPTTLHTPNTTAATTIYQRCFGRLRTPRSHRSRPANSTLKIHSNRQLLTCALRTWALAEVLCPRRPHGLEAPLLYLKAGRA